MAHYGTVHTPMFITLSIIPQMQIVFQSKSDTIFVQRSSIGTCGRGAAILEVSDPKTSNETPKSAQNYKAGEPDLGGIFFHPF